MFDINKVKCYTINSNLWKWYLRNWKYRHSIDIADDVDLKECYFNFYGEGNKIIINSGVKIRGLSLTIYGKGVNLTIEENTKIKETSVLLTNGSSLIIGKDSIISGLSVFNFKDDNHITIGNSAYINGTKEKSTYLCRGGNKDYHRT